MVSGLFVARPVVASPLEGEATQPPTPRTQAADRSPVEEAEDLYRRGVSAYEMFDYDRAIQLWSDAYHLVRDVEGTDESRLSLLRNIATARLKAYAIDGNAAQLRKAKLLLESYLEGIGAVRDEEGWRIPEASLSKELLEETIHVEAKLREIDAKLSGTPAPAATTSTSGSTPATRDDAPRGKHDRKGVVLVAAGASIGVLGIGMLAMMGAGLARGRRAQDEFDDDSTPASELDGARDQGRRANALAVAGGVLAVVFIATSTALTVMGVRRLRTTSRGSVARTGALGLRWGGVRFQ